jgi:predicted MPP superfamily phosphohydrolase
LDIAGWFAKHLPALGVPWIPRIVALFLVGALACALGASSAVLLLLGRVQRWRLPSGIRRLLWVGLLPATAMAVCLCYATLIEPSWLEVTHSTIRSDRIPEGSRVRIALLSDLHVSNWTPVLRQLPQTVNAEHPDLVVYTGDSVNTPDGLPIFRSVLGDMHATWGTYGVLGNHDLQWRPELHFFDGIAHELNGDPVVTAKGLVTLCGSRWDQPDELMACLDQAGPGLHIAAYHSPDMVERAAEGGADLYLAGHTHGGQFRLPFYGALVTMSAFDKTYEAGQYVVDEDTTVYVNRGIGTTAKIPPLRFLCRPELTIIDVIGTGETVAPRRTVRVLKKGDRIILPPAVE